MTILTRNITKSVTRSNHRYSIVQGIWNTKQIHTVRKPIGIRKQILKDKSRNLRLTVIPKIFEDGFLKSYIERKSQDPWKDTFFEGYVHMDPKQKGDFGEEFVSRYLGQLNFTVEPRKGTGHDRIVDGRRIEIKFSLALKDTKGGIREDRFIINHISGSKEWDRLLFMGINSESKIQIIWFTRNDFTNYIASNPHGIFRKQQGGKNGQNDDYLCSGKSFLDLMRLNFVHVGIQDF